MGETRGVFTVHRSTEIGEQRNLSSILPFTKKKQKQKQKQKTKKNQLGEWENRLELSLFTVLLGFPF